MGIALVEVRQPGRRPLVLAVDQALELGRDCDGLLLMDPEVSRRHVLLSLSGGVLTIEDLRSTNGTLLNGEPLKGAAPLRETDVARLGSTEVRVVREADLGAGGAAASAPRARLGTVISGTEPETVVRARTTDEGTSRRTSIDVVAEAASREALDTAKLQVEGGTVTIVFSDIEASTELAMKLGDNKWFELLGTHNDIIRRLVHAHRGTEVKSQGDGFMLTFPSARAAVRCVCEAQRELAAHALEHPDLAMRVRIGVHTGEAIADGGGDLFGRHIIVAARIANLAEGGQILASGITKEIAATGDLRFGESRQVTLKGIEGEYPVHEVLWEEA